MRILNSYNDFIKENLQPEVSKENLIRSKINRIIDFTVIKPGTVKDRIKEAIDLSINQGFYSVCVNPELVDFTTYEIEDNDLKVVSTLDFPDGNMKSSEKLNETIKIISDGADEIDMAIDIDYFKKAYVDEDEEMKLSKYSSLEQDIREISNECHKNGVILKVVIETGLLSLEELKDIAGIVSKANADYIQTSTGNKEVGAELSKVKELRRLLPDYIKIKAAGGIRTLDEAQKYYPYVDRIGTSVILK